MSTLLLNSTTVLSAKCAKEKKIERSKPWGGKSSLKSASGKTDTSKKSRTTSSDSLKSEDVKRLDRALVKRAQKGDHQAYRELVERYQTRAHAIALGILGNYQDAEEVAQEAFVKVYKNLGSFRGQSSFYTWLYRIIFNLSIDLSRKAYRRSEIGMEDSTAIDTAAQYSQNDPGLYMGTMSSPDRDFQRSEIREKFKLAMKELSPEHRTVITLREIDGLSYAEISAVVGCSKGTVMSRLHHARKRLQTLLRELRPLEDSENATNEVSEDDSEERGAQRKRVEKTGAKQTV